MSTRLLVAGARGGIGSACVAAAGRRTWDTVGVDRPEVDCTAPGGAEQAVELATSQMGGIDGVVHAIGMSGRRLGDGPVSECSDEAWAEIMRVNLESAFRLVRAAFPALRRSGGGSIVLIGSALGRTLDADFLTAAYATSKAGLETLARVTAFEGAPLEIRVNVVSPALVDTPMASRALGDARIQQRLDRLMPLGGKSLRPQEVAETALWLVSPETASITGAVLPVDRGWTLR